MMDGDEVAQRIAILIPYFGPWPVWINFFLESCRSNKTVDWVLFTDQDPPENSVRNVRYVRMSFADYKELASDALRVKVSTPEPYKLCDIRPALGHIHADLVRGYDFVGFGDLDVIYGDLLSFYDDEVLAQYDVLSSHADRVSGHLCLMRNREDVVTAYRRATGWKGAFARPDYVNFDERAFYHVFRSTKANFLGRIGAKPFRTWFREAYSTPAATDGMRWFWTSGRLTNEFYPQHAFMYLHFMSWHSNRWYASQPHMDPGTAAPWSLLPQVVQMDWRDTRTKGFMISPAGIGTIEWPTL